MIMTHGKTSLLFEEVRGKIGADTLPPFGVGVEGKNVSKKALCCNKWRF